MNRLAELILKKPLNDCTTDELNRITEKYPYFNAGHLLRVGKTRIENSTDTKNIFQKASLHFNPVQLFSLLNKSGNIVVIPKESVQAVINPPAVEAILEKQPETISVQESGLADKTTTSAEAAVQIAEEPIQSEIKQESAAAMVEEPATIVQRPELPQPETVSQQTATDEIQLAFEPYHTIDYFASQGIKVKLEENPPDKFSKQLRSFTEWLKTMKKLPDAAINIPANIHSEQKVEHLAETSLTDSTILTEAMAEVWIKQGNPEKAIEIYRKLSLLEPAKTTYFASRISAIKNN